MDWNGLLSLGREATVGKPHKEIQDRRRSRQHFHCFEVRRDRVSRDLATELIAQDNHVLELIRQRTLVRIAAVPDLRFAEEAESRTLDYLGFSAKRIGSEKDRRAKDPFKGGY